uniref:Uncharacterized protein n=1 Tax=Chromera velia CCMP2878 TaxID=1169474 RepID=A0A0G4FY14_9ALVE|eukprot:Cvel_19246.t1-p1 / transcript=Cvel_19246.t1 / gene=Cvel_19246 / organism=Chromera_velia_CCMP2878 / gene_product=hypothetical protein / transcript_product=hypothetical protein / location=Cvel_scaffold1646:14211-21971(-) / protein_length=1638 / sequence_SO=supercontig / SO=protein_coding / is_pseudo=false
MLQGLPKEGGGLLASRASRHVTVLAETARRVPPGLRRVREPSDKRSLPEPHSSSVFVSPLPDSVLIDKLKSIERAAETRGRASFETDLQFVAGMSTQILQKIQHQPELYTALLTHTAKTGYGDAEFWEAVARMAEARSSYLSAVQLAYFVNPLALARPNVERLHGTSAVSSLDSCLLAMTLRMDTLLQEMCSSSAVKSRALIRGETRVERQTQKRSDLRMKDLCKFLSSLAKIRFKPPTSFADSLTAYLRMFQRQRQEPEAHSSSVYVCHRDEREGNTRDLCTVLQSVSKMDFFHPSSQAKVLGALLPLFSSLSSQEELTNENLTFISLALHKFSPSLLFNKQEGRPLASPASQTQTRDLLAGLLRVTDTVLSRCLDGLRMSREGGERVSRYSSTQAFHLTRMLIDTDKSLQRLKSNKQLQNACLPPHATASSWARLTDFLEELTDHFVRSERGRVSLEEVGRRLPTEEQPDIREQVHTFVAVASAAAACGESRVGSVRGLRGRLSACVDLMIESGFVAETLGEADDGVTSERSRRMARQRVVQGQDFAWIAVGLAGASRRHQPSVQARLSFDRLLSLVARQVTAGERGESGLQWQLLDIVQVLNALAAFELSAGVSERRNMERVSALVRAAVEEGQKAAGSRIPHRQAQAVRDICAVLTAADKVACANEKGDRHLLGPSVSSVLDCLTSLLRSEGVHRVGEGETGVLLTRFVSLIEPDDVRAEGAFLDCLKALLAGGGGGGGTEDRSTSSVSSQPPAGASHSRGGKMRGRDVTSVEMRSTCALLASLVKLFSPFSSLDLPPPLRRCLSRDPVLSQAVVRRLRGLLEDAAGPTLERSSEEAVLEEGKEGEYGQSGFPSSACRSPSPSGIEGGDVASKSSLIFLDPQNICDFAFTLREIRRLVQAPPFRCPQFPSIPLRPSYSSPPLDSLGEVGVEEVKGGLRKKGESDNALLDDLKNLSLTWGRALESLCEVVGGTAVEGIREERHRRGGRGDGLVHSSLLPKPVSLPEYPLLALVKLLNFLLSLGVRSRCITEIGVSALTSRLEEAVAVLRRERETPAYRISSGEETEKGSHERAMLGEEMERILGGGSDADGRGHPSWRPILKVLPPFLHEIRRSLPEAHGPLVERVSDLCAELWLGLPGAGRGKRGGLSTGICANENVELVDSLGALLISFLASDRLQHVELLRACRDRFLFGGSEEEKAPLFRTHSQTVVGLAQLDALDLDLIQRLWRQTREKLRVMSEKGEGMEKKDLETIGDELSALSGAAALCSGGPWLELQRQRESGGKEEEANRYDGQSVLLREVLSESASAVAQLAEKIRPKKIGVALESEGARGSQGKFSEREHDCVGVSESRFASGELSGVMLEESVGDVKDSCSPLERDERLEWGSEGRRLEGGGDSEFAENLETVLNCGLSLMSLFAAAAGDPKLFGRAKSAELGALIDLLPSAAQSRGRVSALTDERESQRPAQSTDAGREGVLWGNSTADESLEVRRKEWRTEEGASRSPVDCGPSTSFLSEVLDALPSGTVTVQSSPAASSDCSPGVAPGERCVRCNSNDVAGVFSVDLLIPGGQPECVRVNIGDLNLRWQKANANQTDKEGTKERMLQTHSLSCELFHIPQSIPQRSYFETPAPQKMQST